MNASTVKTRENKNKLVSAAGSRLHNLSQPSSKFVGNPSDKVVQGRIALANNIAEDQRLKAFQETADNSYQVKRAAQLQAITNNHSVHQPQNIVQDGLINNSNTIQRTLTKVDDVDAFDMSPLRDSPGTGLGADIKGTAKSLTTNVTWGPLHRSGEGTSVNATVLGPDHKLGSKTASNTGISARVQMFNEAFTGTWKQGHLLNDGLGGPGGEASNLVAISASTNSRMLTDFEDDLQRWVNKEGKWVHFSIVVTHSPINYSDSLEAIKEETSDADQYFYASKLKVSWGMLDEDGAPTQSKTTITLAQPEPVTRKYKAPKTKPDNTPVITDTGSTNAQAITEIGADEIVLDSDEGVRSQVVEKQRLLLGQAEEGMEMEYHEPLSPFSQQEVDEELTSKFAFHSGHQGKSQSRYLLENRKEARKNAGYPYFVYASATIKKKKLEARHDIPAKIAALGVNNHTTDVNFVTTWQNAADAKYPELKSLGFVVFTDCQTNGRATKDLLLKTFYEQNPTALKAFYEELKKTWT